MNSHLKSKYSNLNIIAMYYIIIAILTIYATYKNGIVLYNKHLIQMAAIFKPIILVIIAIGIPIIINAVYKTFIKKEVYELKQDYFPAFMGLTTLCLPINISIILFLLLTIVISVIKLFYNFLKANNLAIRLISFYIVLV